MFPALKKQWSANKINFWKACEKDFTHKQHTQQRGNAGAFAPWGGELLPATLGGEVESQWPGEEILDTDTRVREVTGSLLLICRTAAQPSSWHGVRGSHPSNQADCYHREPVLLALVPHGSMGASPGPAACMPLSSRGASAQAHRRHINPTLKICGPCSGVTLPQETFFSLITLSLRTMKYSKQTRSCYSFSQLSTAIQVWKCL